MISVPSFAKINLGLKIGPVRPDGFHELRTIYQTLALHDWFASMCRAARASRFVATIRACRGMSRTPATRLRSE